MSKLECRRRVGPAGLVTKGSEASPAPEAAMGSSEASEVVIMGDVDQRAGFSRSRHAGPAPQSRRCRCLLGRMQDAMFLHCAASNMWRVGELCNVETTRQKKKKIVKERVCRIKK